MKLLFYLFICCTLLVSSCSTKDEVKTEGSHIFSLGSEKLAFRGGMYVDYGYDILSSPPNESYEYMMSFNIADKAITRENVNVESNFNYVVSVFFTSNSKEPYFGKYTIGDEGNRRAKGSFYKRGLSEELFFESGFFIIENLGGGEFSFQLDVTLSNGEKAVGTYKGVFERFTDEDFD